MKIAYTVCNRLQLSHALVLAHSFRKHNPGRHFFLGWVDRMKLPELPDWIKAVAVESLEIADWSGMEHRYLDFELLTACKPFFAQFLLAAYPGHEELAYLSPTTQVFESLDQIAHSDAFLQLSPQRLRPIDAPSTLPVGTTVVRSPNLARLDDKRILNTGMYQSGSWIMHPDGQEKAMLAWWCARMTDRGYLNLCEGMCLDQLWLNYLPIYYHRVETIRNTGWQYGLSAVPGSEITFTNGRYYVNDAPLLSLDFAGLESHHPLWSDHEGLVKNHLLWTSLRERYRDLLRQYDFQNDETTLPYGTTSPDPSDRKYRKTVHFLEKVIDRVTYFDWTYK